MSSDREILREAIELFKDKVDIKFEMYMLPMKIAQELHKTFTFTKFSHVSKDEIEKLLVLGQNIVKANCATYSIIQDEPAPFGTHLKY